MGWHQDHGFAFQAKAIVKIHEIVRLQAPLAEAEEPKKFYATIRIAQEILLSPLCRILKKNHSNFAQQ